MEASHQPSPFQHIDEIFQQQRQHQWEIRRTSARERIQFLKTLRGVIEARKEEIAAAIYQDFMKPESETFLTEIYLVFKEIDHAISHLPRWLKPVRKHSPIPYWGARSRIVYEPKGTCLIMAPWNYPFQLAIAPLALAIAAGNTVIVKPSELAPRTADIIHDIVREVFPPHHVAVITGGGDVAQYLTHLPFDHIFFTGSTAKGKLVMKAAAQNLTSVTLELGGKSPTIITRQADIRHAARRLAWGKFLNAGQTCIAPDYLLVDQSVADSFIKELIFYTEKFWGKPEEQRQPGRMTHIINEGHFHRLRHLIDDALEKGATLVYGGEVDMETRFLMPTIITNAPENALILQEEIFGPILPILTFAYLEDALQFIRQRPKPLAMYIFSRDKKEIRHILKESTAGSTVINDVLHQFSNPELPFGGVNLSGIGKAHGFYSFREFSNERSVMRLTKWHAIDLVMPPYTEKVKRLIQLTLKYF